MHVFVSVGGCNCEAFFVGVCNCYNICDVDSISQIKKRFLIIGCETFIGDLLIIKTSITQKGKIKYCNKVLHFS